MDGFTLIVPPTHKPQMNESFESKKNIFFGPTKLLSVLLFDVCDCRLIMANIYYVCV